MTQLPQIILASKSPRRHQLLKQLNVDFQVFVPDVTELTQATAKETVISNAKLKAEAAALSFPNAIVIAADTVVAHETRILEKPEDMNAAMQMLSSLSGQKHEVHTAIAIIHNNELFEYNETSEVTFKKLNKEIIESYFTKCNPLDKAGAYNIDESGEMIIENISGDYENIMGLPTHKIASFLKNV